jgi:hypothetical protein
MLFNTASRLPFLAVFGLAITLHYSQWTAGIAAIDVGAVWLITEISLFIANKIFAAGKICIFARYHAPCPAVP